MTKKDISSRLSNAQIKYFSLGFLGMISFMLIAYFILLKNNELKELNLCFFQISITFSNINLLILIILIGFLLFYILTIILLRKINSNITQPFNEIVWSIKGNDLLKKNNVPDEDSDYEHIRNYIDQLEKQILFLEKMDDKNKKTKINFENDLKLARKLQHSILPTINPQNFVHGEFELSIFSQPLFEIGGDIYDYFMIDDEHLFVTIADVSGKGITASLFMIFTLTLLRSITKPELQVNQIVEILNNKLIEENISDMFVTILIGILNTKSGEFVYCNAAHNFPCLITNNGNVIELSETHGIPIGIYPERKYSSSTITLNKNDQVFLYTDGLIDSIDENRLKYSIEVLKYNLIGTWFLNSNEVIEKIKASIEQFRGKTPPVDDLTILDLKFTPKHQKSNN